MSLKKLGSDREFARKVERLVGILRERDPGGLRQVLAPVLAERNHALANQLSHGGVAILDYYDRLILTVLSMRYDALDTAVTETTFAVAEIDGVGLISYANPALQDMLPEALGRDFATLFGPRSRDVGDALLSNRRETLRLDLHRGNLPSVRLRGEIGPLVDEHNRRGAYALLFGLDGEEARFDAQPEGILQLDPDGKVVFANRRAKEMIGATQEELRGREAASLFSTSGSIGRPPPIADWLRSADGHRELAELARLDGGGATPVRVTVTPSFDTAESRAGAILTIVSIANELVRVDLQGLLGVPNSEPENLISGVMDAVRRVIPYDLATFGIYTDDMRYHKTLVVRPPPKWTWTTAWFPLGPEVGEFLLSNHTWGDDLKATTKALSPDLDDDEVVKHLVDDGMKGFVTLPISGGGQKVRASLTLLSKQAHRYDGREVEQMRELGVEKALIVAEANISRRRGERLRELEAQLAGASGYLKLARDFAGGIARCLAWDYVAVFGVDRRDNLFRLIAQCKHTEILDVNSEYNLPLTDGLLGTALRENALLSEPNLDAGSQYAYKPVVPGSRSALAVPVRVVQQAAKPSSDEVEWMLCVESSQRNAFQGPEMASLEEVLAQCEGILRQRWQKAVQRCLLDAVEQAVILVDRAGKVRLTNRWANTLLARRGDSLLGEMLETFGAAEADRRLLNSMNPTAQAPLELRVAGAVTVRTLASQRQVNDDYGHRLWLFTDLRELASQSDSRYLEQTVNEVAQNTRLPLMLASNLIRNAKNLAKEPAITEMLESAIRQLNNVDITYERLASTLAIHEEPNCPQQIFDAVQVLWQAVNELPEEDIRSCDLTDLESTRAPKSFLTTGWPEQLNFAFRSMLGYLLVRRPSACKVRIALSNTSDSGLQVLLSVPTGMSADPVISANPMDRIGMAEQRAREAASLASEAVAKAIHRHNGDLQINTQDSSTLAFRVELRPIQPVA
jgi:PAS domain S-box-containing protein